MNEPMPTGMGVVVRTSVGIAEVIAALGTTGTATLAKISELQGTECRSS